jgi:hypothetical protein
MSPVNNENFETLSENIWGFRDMGICIKHIPDGHAFFISVFRNNGSATIIIFRMASQNVVFLY